jgi:hypothetical protein
MRSILIAILFLSGATNAQAAVIYNWVSSPGTDARGTLVLSDDAFLAGRVGGTLSSGAGDPRAFYSGVFTSNPPIASLDFGISVENGGTGMWWSPPYATFPTYVTLTFDLQVVGDGLEGYLSYRGGHIASMSGTAEAWGNFAVDNDFQGSVCVPGVDPNPCAALGGYWQVVSSTRPPANVPEPFSASLLLIGLAGAAAVRHRGREN